jgi:hypothetical protein
LLNEKDLRLLVHDVNNAAEQQVTEKTLDRLFDATWQELEDGIDAAIDGAATAQATWKGEPDDMLAEVVETVRQMERYMDGAVAERRSAIAAPRLPRPARHREANANTTATPVNSTNSGQQRTCQCGN